MHFSGRVSPELSSDGIDISIDIHAEVLPKSACFQLFRYNNLRSKFHKSSLFIQKEI